MKTDQQRHSTSATEQVVDSYSSRPHGTIVVLGLAQPI